MKNKRLKMAVVRGIDVRIPQAEFASCFKSIDTAFVADDISFSKELKDMLNNKIPYIAVPQAYAYLFDPVKLVLGKQTHQSWVSFEQQALDNALRDFDLLEIYEPYFFYSAQVAKLAKKKRIPLITEIWTSFPNHPANFVPPYSLNTKEVIAQTDLFILRSKKALSYLEPFNIPERRKVVIYSGVNLKRFFPRKVKKDEKIRILFVGVLAIHKGLDDLLAVFPRLVEKYKDNIELIICGQGALKEEVIKMSKEYPISYYGYVSNFILPDVYRNSDIFCGPSKEFSSFGIKRWEEFVGYTFMEALASGLPIVSTYCGGISEVVGESNYLVKQGDRKALLDKLQFYIEDREECLLAGKRNRERAERLFDIEKQTLLTEELILRYFKL